MIPVVRGETYLYVFGLPDCPCRCSFFSPSCLKPTPFHVLGCGQAFGRPHYRCRGAMPLSRAGNVDDEKGNHGQQPGGQHHCRSMVVARGAYVRARSRGGAPLFTTAPFLACLPPLAPVSCTLVCCIRHVPSRWYS